MAEFGDFDPILPDPQPLIEKALLLYERAAKSKLGRIVFITAEMGSGKTEQLSALAKALRRAKPAPNLIAGYFKDSGYHRYTLDWQQSVCLKKALIAAGGVGTLMGLFPISYAFAFEFIGQLLETSIQSHNFAEEFQKEAPRRGEDAERLKQVIRRASEKAPLLVLLDDWDEAERFAWDSMLISLAREVARDLPLLMFITVREPIRLNAAEDGGSSLVTVIDRLTEKGLAEVWPVRKLTAAEVATAIGQAVPSIAAKLHGVTGGNARWVRELWREWRLRGVVEPDQSDRWVWGAQSGANVNLYDDILRDRLRRLLGRQDAIEVEEVRDVLACAALEGEHFTAQAVALAAMWDDDDLYDLLDDVLLQTEQNPDGLLRDEESVAIHKPDGEKTTLWRYSFVSDLHWMALNRYGFADEHRLGRSGSERLEKSSALVDALTELYTPEERLVAAPLARLLRGIGQVKLARRFQRMADYTAGHEIMRELALHILALNKDDWELWECRRNAEFLTEAGEAMLNAYPYTETLAVVEKALELANRVKDKRAAAEAGYLCAFILSSEGDFGNARVRAIDSLSNFQATKSKDREIISLRLLAQIDFAEGNYAAAREGASHSLKVARKIGDQQEEAASLYQLAQIDYAEGDYTAARERATQSLKIARDTGNRQEESGSLYQLAQIYYAEGNDAAAREGASQSLEIDREIGDRPGEASSLNLLARIDHAEGDYAAALDGAVQGLRIIQEIGDHSEVTAYFHLLGMIAVGLGKPEESLDLFALSLLSLTPPDHPFGETATAGLEESLVELHYTEEKKKMLFQRVEEAIQMDGGGELIGKVIAALFEAVDEN
jgi:tetratricopeptide (TPR) repeat protein